MHGSWKIFYKFFLVIHFFSQQVCNKEKRQGRRKIFDHVNKSEFNPAPAESLSINKNSCSTNWPRRRNEQTCAFGRIGKQCLKVNSDEYSKILRIV